MTDEKKPPVVRIVGILGLGIAGGLFYTWFIEWGSSAGLIVAGACALVLFGMWLYEQQS